MIEPHRPPSFLLWSKDTKMLFLKILFETVQNTPEDEFITNMFRDKNRNRCVMARALDNADMRSLLGLRAIPRIPVEVEFTEQTEAYTNEGISIEFSEILVERWLLEMVGSVSTSHTTIVSLALDRVVDHEVWRSGKTQLLCRILFLADLVYADSPVLQHPYAIYGCFVKEIRSGRFTGIYQDSFLRALKSERH